MWLMAYDPKKHHRRSIRLCGYDYAQTGLYYVTLCTQDRQHLFGAVVNGEMQPGPAGLIAGECWEWLAARYDHVALDQWVVMPNHLHGIIALTDQMGTHVTGESACRGGSQTAPTGDAKRKPLGRLIGAFKTVSTKRINELRGTPGAPVWQRDFFEHIIRDDNALNRIRQYIQDNPANWAFDTDNPEAMATAAEDPWRE
jgi:putative transposase